MRSQLYIGMLSLVSITLRLCIQGRMWDICWTDMRKGTHKILRIKELGFITFDVFQFEDPVGLLAMIVVSSCERGERFWLDKHHEILLHHFLFPSNILLHLGSCVPSSCLKPRNWMLKKLHVDTCACIVSLLKQDQRWWSAASLPQQSACPRFYLRIRSGLLYLAADVGRPLLLHDGSCRPLEVEHCAFENWLKSVPHFAKKIQCFLFCHQLTESPLSAPKMKRSFYAARDLYKYRHSYPVRSQMRTLGVHNKKTRKYVAGKCDMDKSVFAWLQNYRKSRQPNEYRNLRFYLNKIPLIPDGEFTHSYTHTRTHTPLLSVDGCRVGFWPIDVHVVKGCA